MNGTCQPGDNFLLQPIWAAIRSHEDLLLSKLFPTCFVFFAHLVACLYFILLDFMEPHVPCLWRYKLSSQDSRNTKALWECLWKTASNQVVCIPSVSLLCTYLRPQRLPDKAPSCFCLAFEVVQCLLLFDALYFCCHFLLHRVPYLYQKVHSVHHQYQETFALVAQYSSPWDAVILQMTAFSCTALLHCHPLSEMSFHLLNIWLSVEVHSGYDFPWASHRMVPLGLLGGAPFHNLHHQQFKCNYAPYFTHWDRLFQTFVQTSKKQI
ncbi:cholesterol 25-hydroxylase-like protein [Erpetoichthys calabaricus]|uniref:cholesterol 25-hydroxylase-like protein n=1 Tax=Erpetoichthys calabaricus TaxID=27687 RepID=UPI0022342886|nr:cholesterol 25-hydroxylase-like protein [Erpetoichthys calabaricus]